MSRSADRPRLPGFYHRLTRHCLTIRPGFNPNSSSLGFDVSALVAGLAGVTLATLCASAWVRLRGGRRGGEPPATGEADPAPALPAGEEAAGPSPEPEAIDRQAPR